MTVEPAYELEVTHETPRGPKTYVFSSADGVHAKTSLREPELLLLDAVDVVEASDLLVHQGGYGVLPVILGDRMRDGALAVTERSARATGLGVQNAERNQVSNVTYHNTDEIPGQGYDAAVFAPRPYESVDYVNDCLARLIASVKHDGYVFVAGSADTGVERHATYLTGLSGWCDKIAERGQVAAYAYSVTGSESLSASGVETSFTAEYDGFKANFSAAQGLFSKNRLDPGSKALLDAVDIHSRDRVLDLCCGYGAIGTFLGRAAAPELVMTDDDALATTYADKNVDQNGVDADVRTGDCLDSVGGSFDTIVSNPPTHAGRGVTQKLFEQSKAHLSPNGSYYVVYNADLEYKEILGELYERAHVVSTEDNYRVCEAKK